ncbi:von Willebrand factor, type A [Phaffia rhodozyma]|uniref:von Willebrand factor, type A n=1 Tax=Phaffia rhodozyma TaxID=264483 RepID=A0A0F7SXH3_PHARH|nr:von Willebrand factor, type A [Phaffia rhodozyma]
MGLASKLAAAQSSGAAPPAQTGGPSSLPPIQTQQPQYGQQYQQQQQNNPYGQQYQQPQSAYPASPVGGAPAVPMGRPLSYQGGHSQTTQQGQYGAPQGPAPGQYAPPSGPPPSHQSHGKQPPPQGYQPQYGQQPQSQYGAPPPAYGAPPASQSASIAPGAVPLDPRVVEGILQACVVEQHIEAFYPPGSLGPIANRIAGNGAIDHLASTWRMPKELAMDLLKLSLFDVILLVDDSGSMAFEEGGERIDDLKLILSRVAHASSLFDTDGIQVRFLNSNVEGNNITSEQGATQLLSQIRYSGLTPLGTSLDKKILQPLVLGPARAGRLEKPVLIIVITDGTPAGEPKDMVFRVITNASNELKRTRYGSDAISFQFAQVGNDLKAQAFLGELDVDPAVGDLVDCTSNYESEADEMMRKSGMELTPELWLVKLLMGGIDVSYDEQDEVRR